MSAQFDSTPGLHLPQPSVGGTQPMQPMAHMPAQPMQQPVFPVQQGPAFVASPATQQPLQQFPQAQAAPQSIAPQPAFVPAVETQALPMEQLQQQPELQAVATQSMALPQDSDNEKDGDALDEEWITKTKALIEQYKNDPYALSNALSALKADYMKVRHGMIVKVNDRPS